MAKALYSKDGTGLSAEEVAEVLRSEGGHTAVEVFQALKDVCVCEPEMTKALYSKNGAGLFAETVANLWLDDIFPECNQKEVEKLYDQRKISIHEADFYTDARMFRILCGKLYHADVPLTEVVYGVICAIGWKVDCCTCTVPI